MAEKTEKKPVYTVLPKKLGGGPCGLGDPDDKSLRKVEKDVIIMQKVRTKARTEKCIDEVKAFNDCCKEASFAMVFTCRQQTKVMKECYAKWFQDENFIAECTKEYLDERTAYRRTGITRKQKQFANRMSASV